MVRKPLTINQQLPRHQPCLLFTNLSQEACRKPYLKTMQRRPLFWLIITLLCLAAILFFRRPTGDRQDRATSESQISNLKSQIGAPELHAVPTAKAQAEKNDAEARTSTTTRTSTSASKAPDRVSHRLSNTSETIGQLARNDHAILLANAFIDTAKPLN